MIFVYAAAKFLAYGLWCYFGLRLAGRADIGIAKAAGLGTLRWLIGFGFGAGVFLFAGSINASDAARMYFQIYTPLRVIEWGVMAFIIGQRLDQATMTRLSMWCAGGMLVSFLTDLLSPEGLQGKFCVGRCLC